MQPSVTLSSAIEQFMATLEAQGKHPRTLYTYRKDCEQILAYFGPDKKVSNILPAHVARFFKSDALLKLPKTGQHRAPATIRKTQGVFRMLLVWAVEQGYLSTLPWPRRPFYHTLLEPNPILHWMPSRPFKRPLVILEISSHGAVD